MSLAHSHRPFCAAARPASLFFVRSRRAQYGQTALVFASFSGYQDVVEILLRYQAQPDIQTKVRGDRHRGGRRWLPGSSLEEPGNGTAAVSVRLLNRAAAVFVPAFGCLLLEFSSVRLH